MTDYKLILGFILLSTGIGFGIGFILISIAYIFDNSVVYAFGITSPLFACAFACFFIGIKIKLEIYKNKRV